MLGTYIKSLKLLYNNNKKIINLKGTSETGKTTLNICDKELT